MSENNILGVVLAGGKSKRFGDDKTTAKLGEKTLLDHTVEKIEKKFDEILIISNNDLFPNFARVLSSPNLFDLPPANTTPKILFLDIKLNISHILFK